jgi:hypothetical protein
MTTPRIPLASSTRPSIAGFHATIGGALSGDSSVMAVFGP